MSGVKRYDCATCSENGYQYGAMEERDGGAYVSYGDYAALQSRIAELEAERDELRADRERWRVIARSLKGDYERVEGNAADLFDRLSDACREYREALRPFAEIAGHAAESDAVSGLPSLRDQDEVLVEIGACRRARALVEREGAKQ